ncbi:ATP-binding protein [Streptomyces sp. NPDC047108]|uniref:ATP-binding protein n=1 Tax=Streptomyces sp. NPDC047108 TaxID=3155025 RepID=UPI0033FA5DA5
MAGQRGDSVLNKRLRRADLAAVAEVRESLRELLRQQSWGKEEQADVAELLISELVTNALVHTGRGAQVTATLVAGHAPDGPTAVDRDEDRLRVEVRDFADRRPVVRRPDGEGTGGRGMMLVQALADTWGVRPVGAGKIVWFELAGEPV